MVPTYPTNQYWAKSLCQTILGHHRVSYLFVKIFLADTFEHGISPSSNDLNIAHSPRQVPQPTFSWKRHPVTCQLGNPTTFPYEYNQFSQNTSKNHLCFFSCLSSVLQEIICICIVKRIFIFFATKASFLHVIANLQIKLSIICNTSCVNRDQS